MPKNPLVAAVAADPSLESFEALAEQLEAERAPLPEGLVAKALP